MVYIDTAFYSVAGVEVNFFNNLPVGHVISNLYLLEEISTCLKQIGLLSFKVV